MSVAFATHGYLLSRVLSGPLDGFLRPRQGAEGANPAKVKRIGLARPHRDRRALPSSFLLLYQYLNLPEFPFFFYVATEDVSGPSSPRRIRVRGGEGSVS